MLVEIGQRNRGTQLTRNTHYEAQFDLDVESGRRPEHHVAVRRAALTVRAHDRSA